MLAIRGGVDGDGGTGEVGGGVGSADGVPGMIAGGVGSVDGVSGMTAGGVGSVDGVSGMIAGGVGDEAGGGATIPGDSPGKPIKAYTINSARIATVAGAQTSGLDQNFPTFRTLTVCPSSIRRESNLPLKKSEAETWLQSLLSREAIFSSSGCNSGT